MIILGIDPGFAIVGYGCLKNENHQFKPLDYGVIKTHKDLDFNIRLKIIFDGLNQIIDQYNPDVMAVEEIFFARNTKTAMKVAQARGVILLCATLQDIPVFEYRPNQVKQAVTGYDDSQKNQIQNAISVILGLSAPPKPDDAADALAVAICHCNHSNVYKNIS